MYPDGFMAARGKADEKTPAPRLRRRWGLFPNEHAVYINYNGRLPAKGHHTATYKVPENNAFWSITVYGADGYMKSDNSILNKFNTKMNEDGTFTVHFGSKEDCGDVPNRLDVSEGWNFLMRVYRPGKSVLDGSYKLPDVTLAKALAKALTPAEARAIAKEAYIYGFPLVDNMRVQYSYFTDKKDPDYKAPYNTLFNIPRVFTPDDKAIQTPNSDTPYSWIGLDLRAEPIVFTVPPIAKERYWSLQLIDLYTHNFDYSRQSHDWQRWRQFSHRRPELERGKAQGYHEGDPLRDRNCFGPVSDAALQSRRPRQRQEDSGAVYREAVIGLPQPTGP